MNPVSPYPAIAAILIAFACAYIISLFQGNRTENERFTSIDGLRGYLAFFVFLHHSVIWYFFLRTGQWKVAPSNLYTHFGQSSVTLFFMITGFLFFSKLIDGQKKPIDWNYLFLSRILRLTPLYFSLVIILLIIVGQLSGFTLVESPARLLKGISRWVIFTASGAPDLNGVKGTSLIVASVTWSLPYEWFFYLSLPLFSIPFRIPSQKIYIIVGILGIIGAVTCGRTRLIIISAFSGGVIAAFLVRSKKFRSFAVLRISSLIVTCCIAVSVIYSQNAYSCKVLFLLSTAFVIIASGNSLFGLLTHPASKILGDISYSIYLLHGSVLFIVFTFVITTTKAATFSVFEHWIVIVACSPVLIILSFTTFRLIEVPAIKWVPYLLSDIRAIRNRKPSI